MVPAYVNPCGVRAYVDRGARFGALVVYDTVHDHLPNILSGPLHCINTTLEEG